MKRRRALHWRNERGATIVEFAIILPVMLTLIMGLSELTYQMYVQSILSGAVQKAGRDSSIQGGAQETGTIDLAVMSVVWQAANKATYVSTRESYSDFADIAPEPFVDTNHNGIRDKGECFTDINGNGVWDADPGLAGQGGANDVTRYTMTITYPHLFPVAGWFGWSPNETTSASTLLKNQPYASQTVPTPATICS
jgi:Flp pilus assembly protein TadG